MTNRQALIHGLSEKECADYVVDYIACPYSTEDCVNAKKSNKSGTQKYYDSCCKCKTEWLEKDW